MKSKTEMELHDVGARLRSIREELNLTLEKMGDLANFSKSQISAAEKGEKKPSSLYLFTLAHHFNVNINYILTGKGHPFLDKPNKSGDEKDLDELFTDLQHDKMLRYSVLGYFYELKKRNPDSLPPSREKP